MPPDVWLREFRRAEPRDCLVYARVRLPYFHRGIPSQHVNCAAELCLSADVSGYGWLRPPQSCKDPRGGGAHRLEAGLGEVPGSAEAERPPGVRRGRHG
eukprot:4091950-Pyramimonas_sp.AAC.1